jgi:hypothetical protein
MRISRWIWLVVVLFAGTLLWMGIHSLRRPKTPSPITDLGATMPLNQPGGGVVSTEAYAVYSALYQAPMQEPLVFSEDSLTDIPQVNGSCLRPTAAQEQEMTDAFVAANQQTHRWEQKFSIPQGYRLLPHSELTQENYKQIRYVRLLGVPGFDHAHTRALVSVIKSCGHLCGSGGIFAVERMGGTWQRSATTDFTRDCSWMY